MKKNLFILLMITTLFACKKGDIGPAGQDGEDGTDGKDGNANVTLIRFGQQVFTSALNLALPNTITRAKTDSSLILVYYNPSTELESAWYPVPGLGSGASYDTRFLVYEAAGPMVLAIRLTSPDTGLAYPNQVTFRKLRVFLVPASQIINGRPADGSSPAVDYSDYYSVLNYYGLKD